MILALYRYQTGDVMPLSAKEYREHLYSQRTHPNHQGKLKDAGNSMSGMYWALIPFLATEYWAELRVDTLPSGIIFPTAYLLFWAFYFTYYRPGSLESGLSSPQKWDLFGLPTVMVGICVWFVKVAVVEFTEVIVSSLLPKKRPAPRKEPPRYQHATPPPPPRQETTSGLPKEIESALAIMGLSGCRDWRMIQKRYRELAKKYHPDLNHEITTAGNRFMIYDAAYKRLSQVKAKYFH